MKFAFISFLPIDKPIRFQRQRVRCATWSSSVELSGMLDPKRRTWIRDDASAGVCHGVLARAIRSEFPRTIPWFSSDRDPRAEHGRYVDTRCQRANSSLAKKCRTKILDPPRCLRGGDFQRGLTPCRVDR